MHPQLSTIEPDVVEAFYRRLGRHFFDLRTRRFEHSRKPGDKVVWPGGKVTVTKAQCYSIYISGKSFKAIHSLATRFPLGAARSPRPALLACVHSRARRPARAVRTQPDRANCYGSALSSLGSHPTWATWCTSCA